jgi:hypothetical protein
VSIPCGPGVPHYVGLAPGRARLALQLAYSKTACHPSKESPMPRPSRHTLACSFLCAAFALPGAADASLVDRGGGLIYDTDLNITWLADANYAFTSGYDQEGATDGLMTYAYATAWAAQLTYGGFTEWRLPTTLQPDPTCAQQYSFGSGQYNCTGSEMGHLYYTEFASVAGNGGIHNASYNLFTNLQSDLYWSSTSVATIPTFAWQFSFIDGNQYVNNKAGAIRAMAVHPGDIGAATTVPAPAALWLLGTGLATLAGTRRRSNP